MRCEHDSETLGLTILDEPAALQSDPTILDLQLRSVSKQTGRGGSKVKRVQDAAADSKVIVTGIILITCLSGGGEVDPRHRGASPEPAPAYCPVLEAHAGHRQPDAGVAPAVRGAAPGSQHPVLQHGHVAQSVCGRHLLSHGHPCLQVGLTVTDIFHLLVARSRLQTLHVLFTLFLAFR